MTFFYFYSDLIKLTARTITNSTILSSSESGRAVNPRICSNRQIEEMFDLVHLTKLNLLVLNEVSACIYLVLKRCNSDPTLALSFLSVTDEASYPYFHEMYDYLINDLYFEYFRMRFVSGFNYDRPYITIEEARCFSTVLIIREGFFTHIELEEVKNDAQILAMKDNDDDDD